MSGRNYDVDGDWDVVVVCIGCDDYVFVDGGVGCDFCECGVGDCIYVVDCGGVWIVVLLGMGGSGYFWVIVVVFIYGIVGDE